MSTALFRCDGGAQVGEGHLSRTLPLALELAQAGFACALATATPQAPTVALWRSHGLPVAGLDVDPGSPADAEATAETSRRLAAAAGGDPATHWIVLDGYRFDAPFAERTGSAARTVFFEDTGAHDPAADILVNQNAGAEKRHADAYRRPALTLLGPRYASIRPSFREVRRDDRGGVLVSLGGSADPALSLAVAEAAARVATAEITVVASAAPAPRNATIHAVPPQDLAPLLAAARIAVIGGGVTALEAAFLGVPAVVLVLADNQRPGARALREAGCCEIAGDAGEAGRIAAALLKDRPRLERLAAAGPRLVDGLGARRIAEAMASIPGRDTQ